MTNITELEQSLKAAAEKATPGQWMRSSVLFNSITNIANPMEQGNKPHVANTSEKRDAEFIALANPANILALVEALEKAQETIAFQQGEIKALLSSLESRTVTVKLPPKIERNDADGWFMYNGGRVGGGAAEWYNKALDDVGSELTAVGIKWEAE
ncbi:ead/Ea22-like family protein [Klebsiella sp. CN_Kp073]|uniref:ead/Ea22-like family protein n=1 Tax=Klebsiella sp. CN_Kp073 TaxID=3153412 RepID=UPI0032B3DB82